MSRRATPQSPGRDKERDRRLVGETVAGKYRVLEVLGQGGFGSVFLVELTEGVVGTRLAMKVLPSEFGANAVLREQFLNEIHVAMRMVDRYIVQIRDVGTFATQDGGELLYYTMDYVPGESLAEQLRSQGKLSVKRTLSYVIRVLRALRTAHGAGIIHRDLKPANIMIQKLDGKETVRVLDFGIATAVGADDGPKDGPKDGKDEGAAEAGPARRRKRGFAGSPYYMPPEQFLGTDLGLYTDIWAVGVILYECLTGRKPYGGNTPQEVYNAIKRGPPIAVAELAPEAAEYPGLAEVIMKSLERNPEKRFQSARELAEALTVILKGEAKGSSDDAGPRAPRRPRAPRPIAAARPRRRSSPVPAILVALLVVAAVVVGIIFKEPILESVRRQLDSGPSTVTSGASEGHEGVGGQGAGSRTGETGGRAASGAVPARTAAGSGSDAESTTAQTSTSAGRGESGSPGERAASGTDVASAQAAARERFDAAVRDGYAALAANDLRTADEESLAAISLDSSSLRAALLRGEVLSRLGQHSEAIARLEKLIPKLPANAERNRARLVLARALLAVKPPEVAKAEFQYREVLAADPKNAEAILALADSLRGAGRAQDLASLLETAHQAGVEDAQVRKLYEEVVVAARKRAEAEHRDALEKMGAALEAGDHVVAAIQARRALEHERTVAVAEVAHDSAARAGDVANAKPALAALRELVAASPEAQGDEEQQARLLWYDARLAYLEWRQDGKKKHLDEATAKLGLVRDRVNRRTQTDIWAWAHTLLGVIRSRTGGDLAAVEEEFSPTTSHRDAELMLLQAETYQEIARESRHRSVQEDAYKLARARLLNLLRISGLAAPFEQEATFRLAICYAHLGEIQGDDSDLRKAVNRFLAARDLGLDTPALHEYLGWTYHALDERIKAAQSYRDAFRLEPSVARCLQAVDHFLLVRSRHPQAQQLLEEGLAAFPDDPKLLKKLAELTRS